MRIQHNISAMNSYRNFSANNSKISKNLEKLSTGYAINRAGDDAAGLAISEKMRAQISGLEGATKNAKDGISLIQTAEGALTEVHDMLNRMTTLAEQSANGTYQDELDREQLQKEVESLKTEIDRIADSTNFNGLKLLDGSLSSTGKNGVSADLSKLGVDVLSSAKTIAAQKGKFTTTQILNAATTTNSGNTAVTNDKTQFTLTLNITDADGNEKEITKTLRVKEISTANGDDDASKGTKFILEDGTDDGTEVSYTSTSKEGRATGVVTASDLSEAFAAVLSKDADVKANFNVAASGGKLTFESKTAGSNGAKLNNYGMTQKKDRTSTTSSDVTTYTTDIDESPLAEDAKTVYDFSKAKIWSNKVGDTAEKNTADNATYETRDLDEAIIEVNGKKFVFVKDDLTDDDVKALADAGVNQWVKMGSTAKAAHKVSNVEITEMAQMIAKETNLTVEVGQEASSTGTPTSPDGKALNAGAWQKDNGTTGGTLVLFKDSEGTTAGGLSLQIGDTSDSYNKLTVSVGDMHAKMIGIGDVDISTQKGASNALDKIKQAVNTVSDTRGTLGALQNRLDHTINNLGVMRENIQNAESNIRDTDVAEEMMTYTKNSILNQSAQAMLAQANQLPQGVLQLLG